MKYIWIKKVVCKFHKNSHFFIANRINTWRQIWKCVSVQKKWKKKCMKKRNESIKIKGILNKNSMKKLRIKAFDCIYWAYLTINLTSDSIKSIQSSWTEENSWSLVLQWITVNDVISGKSNKFPIAIYFVFQFLQSPR